MTPMVRDVVKFSDGLIGYHVQVTLRGNEKNIEGKVIFFDLNRPYLVLNDLGNKDWTNPIWLDLMDVVAIRLMGKFESPLKKKKDTMD